MTAVNFSDINPESEVNVPAIPSDAQVNIPTNQSLTAVNASDINPEIVNGSFGSPHPNNPLTKFIAKFRGNITISTSLPNASPNDVGQVNKSPKKLKTPFTPSNMPPIKSVISVANEKESNADSTPLNPNTPAIHDTALLSKSRGIPIRFANNFDKPPSSPPRIPPSL